MITAYHQWAVPESQRLRLALAAKGVDFEAVAVAPDDDATFFDLGIARTLPVLVDDAGAVHADFPATLFELDGIVGGEPLVEGAIDRGAWDALLDWREKADPLLQRLYAPVVPAFRDVGDDDAAFEAWKREAEHRFGMGLEALANDRYAAYEQFATLSRLPELGKYLEQRRFYTGTLSVADCLLAADLAPLQQLDGVSLPVSIMYYIQRVEAACGAATADGLLAA